MMWLKALAKIAFYNTTIWPQPPRPLNVKFNLLKGKQELI